MAVEFPTRSGCCIADVGCYESPTGVRPAIAQVCCGPMLWYDAEFGYVVSNPTLVPCENTPQPSAECFPPTEVNDSTATLNGTGHDIPAIYTMRICYGTTPGGPYPNCGPNVAGDASANQPINYPVAGLTAGTTYYYQVEVRNGANAVITTSEECSFITDAQPPAPSASCSPATSVTDTSATLQGAGQSVPTDHTIRICFGTTPGGPYNDCGPQTLGDTTANQPINRPIAGLTPGTTYYYVTQLRDAGNVTVFTSTECSFVAENTPPPTDVIVFNFPNGQPADPDVLACFENARATLNANFITPPQLHNGDQQIHIDLTVNNDPPFDGTPGGVVGQAGPTSFRPDGTTYSGTMQFEEASIAGPECEAIALHEMLHVLGVGVQGMPNWDAFEVNPNTNMWGWTGPQALAEYQNLPGGFPGAVAIPIEWNTGNPGSDGGHWDTNDGGNPGANGYNQNCLSNELMSYQISGSNTLSRVTAAALRDLGYDYDVNSAAAFACGGA